MQTLKQLRDELIQAENRVSVLKLRIKQYDCVKSTKEEILRGMLTGRRVSLVKVAQTLCMSTRLLQRKLAEKQTSFRKIKNEIIEERVPLSNHLDTTTLASYLQTSWKTVNKIRKQLDK